MKRNDPVSLKSVSYMMIGGGGIAGFLALLVWGVLDVFVV